MKPATLFCLFLVYIILCGINVVYGQKFTPKYLRENDKGLLDLTTSATDNGWIEFRQDKETEAINPDEFLNRFGKSLGLGEGYHLKPTQVSNSYVLKNRLRE